MFVDVIVVQSRFQMYFSHQVCSAQVVAGPIGTRRRHAESFAAIVFILPWETVLIESLFSVMNYNKDKTRSSLADTSVANIINTKD